MYRQPFFVPSGTWLSAQKYRNRRVASRPELLAAGVKIWVKIDLGH